MTDGSLRVHLRPLRAVTVLRVLVLVVLVAVIVGIALTYGRRERPQPQITMMPPPESAPVRGPVLNQSDRFEISGTREGRPAFTLQATTVAGFAGERKLLEEVGLTLHKESGGAVEVVGSRGQFDPTARRAQLNGDVAIRTPDGMSLETGVLFYDSDRDMVFTGDEVRFSVGWLEGTGRGLNYLVGEGQIKIADQVRLRLSDEMGGLPATIASGDLVASLRDNSAIFTDDVRLERGGDILTGQYLRLLLDEDRQQVTGIRAFGDVAVTLAPDANERYGTLRADSLTAALAPETGVIETAEASGGCSFGWGEVTSRSRSALFLRPEDRLELRGDPMVLTQRDRVTAQEIDLFPEREALEARGDVRTVSLPGPETSATRPGFGGRSAVSFQASQLHLDQVARRAIYTGAARAWQGGNSLQADEILVDEAEGRLAASGHVMSRWTEPPPRGESAPSNRPIVTVITADRLILDEAGGAGRYTGNVHLTRLDAELSSERMVAHFKDADEERDLERIEASGSVLMTRGGSSGKARWAEFRNAESLLILRDENGLAEVVDAETGRSMRGRTLTFDLATDRLLTESAQGDRTWITLAPESKDVPPVEPKTRH